MPKGRTVRVKKDRRGRPPMPDAGNYEALYCNLRSDLVLYARKRRAEHGGSLSHHVAALVELGVAYEILKRQEGSP